MGEKKSHTYTCIHEQKVLENYDGGIMAEIAELCTKHTAAFNPKGYPRLNPIHQAHATHSGTRP